MTDSSPGTRRCRRAGFAKRYRRFKKWFIRKYVGRFRLFEVVWAGIVTAKQQGFRAFILRLFRWLRGERRYHADPASQYLSHQKQFEPNAVALQRQKIESGKWPTRPLFNVVTVVDSSDLSMLKKTTDTVLAQTYAGWQWQVVDASADESIGQYLAEQAQQHEQIKVIAGRPDQGSAANANLGLTSAGGDFIVMLNNGDGLAAWALYAVAEVVRQHPDSDFIYSDFDRQDGQGPRTDPLFKPDWSPEAMLGYNLLDYLSAYPRRWLEKVGYLNSDLEGAQDWDLYLRISEYAQHIYHIPQVLYHQRTKPDAPGSAQAQQAAVKMHLQRLGLADPQVTPSATYPASREQPRVTWKSQKRRRVSIIIPSRDFADVLGRCLDSLFSQTTYPDYEVILVDTGSLEPATQALYDRYTADARFRLIRYTEPFNFSRACNFGARQADGELLLFLNNDTEVLHGDWLDLMAQWFDLKGVGIVGPKLLYPDGKIQHAGVIIGLKGLVGHLFQMADEYLETIFGSDGWYRNLLAVTGACVLISREAFDAVHGFDENYKLLFSDIWLCLQVCSIGYRVVYTPHVRLIHHESLTHRRASPRADFEIAYRHWQFWLQKGDPYFNFNLTYSSPIPQLKQDPGENALRQAAAKIANLPHKEIFTPDDF